MTRSWRSQLQKRAEEINKETYEDLNLIIYESYEQLQKKLEDFANEPLVADYFASVDASNAASVPTSDSTQGDKGNPIKDVAKIFLGKATERFGLPRGLITGTKEMARSTGHQLVYNVGKMFGKISSHGKP